MPSELSIASSDRSPVLVPSTLPRILEQQNYWQGTLPIVQYVFRTYTDLNERVCVPSIEC